jgi:hypothetical protein
MLDNCTTPPPTAPYTVGYAYFIIAHTVSHNKYLLFSLHGVHVMLEFCMIFNPHKNGPLRALM